MSAASDKFEREAFVGRMVGYFELPEVAAWKAGLYAWRKGLMQNENPYAAGQLRLEWFNGFLLGKEESTAKAMKGQERRGR